MPVENGDGLFSAKLSELEQQYATALHCLHAYQRADPAQLRQEQARLAQEYRDCQLAMHRRAAQGRSPAVAALAAAQLEYDRAVQRIRADLPAHLHEEGSGPAEDRAEAACLYGEYAMDFAAQALRHALLAALAAVGLERDAAAGGGERTKGTNNL